MFRAALNKRLFCAAFFPFSSANKDADVSTIQIYYDKMKDFVFKEDGTLTNEAQSVVNTTGAGVAVGFTVGGLSKAKRYPTAHKAANQATLYNHKFEAAREMNNKIVMQVFKGGFPYGIKLGFFCFMFSSFSAFLYTYKGKFDVFNGITSGALAGALYKINMGPKGMLAGATAGTIVGFIYGSMTSLLLYITGTDMKNLYETSGKLMEARREKIKENVKKYKSEEDSNLRKWYEQNRKLQSEEEKQEVKA